MEKNPRVLRRQAGRCRGLVLFWIRRSSVPWLLVLRMRDITSERFRLGEEVGCGSAFIF